MQSPELTVGTSGLLERSRINAEGGWTRRARERSGATLGRLHPLQRPGNEGDAGWSAQAGYGRA